MYYYRERLVPYHPSKEDWTKEGDLDLLEIPNFADMAMQSKDPGLERDRDQWPLFRTKGAGVLMKHIHNYMELCIAKKSSGNTVLLLSSMGVYPLHENLPVW